MHLVVREEIVMCFMTIFDSHKMGVEQLEYSEYSTMLETSPPFNTMLLELLIEYLRDHSSQV